MNESNQVSLPWSLEYYQLLVLTELELPWGSTSFERGALASVAFWKDQSIAWIIIIINGAVKIQEDAEGWVSLPLMTFIILRHMKMLWSFEVYKFKYWSLFPLLSSVFCRLLASVASYWKMRTKTGPSRDEPKATGGTKSPFWILFAALVRYNRTISTTWSRQATSGRGNNNKAWLHDADDNTIKQSVNSLVNTSVEFASINAYWIAQDTWYRFIHYSYHQQIKWHIILYLVRRKTMMKNELTLFPLFLKWISTFSSTNLGDPSFSLDHKLTMMILLHSWIICYNQLTFLLLAALQNQLTIYFRLPLSYRESYLSHFKKEHSLRRNFIFHQRIRCNSSAAKCTRIRNRRSRNRIWFRNLCRSPGPSAPLSTVQRVRHQRPSCTRK